MPKKLSPEMVETIQSMGEQGYSNAAICEKTHCAKGTVQKYLAEKSIDNYHVGGKISKTILLPRNDLGNGKKAEKKSEPNVIVADQKITLVGLLTANKYNISLHDENLSAEGDEFCCTVKLDDLPNLAKELMEVYQAAIKMKKGV